MSVLLRMWLVRLVMVLVWVALVFSFLVFPRFLQWIYPLESTSIAVYVWPSMIDGKKIIDFQKKTGIKVYIHYYESNEELLQKLEITGGKGYDLVMPADYAIERLREKGLLHNIDHRKLHFWNRINPMLLGYYFDPLNEYSVPYYVSVYGLGIDPTYFGTEQPTPSWDLLFKRQPGYEVAMTDVPRRAIAFASNYLYQQGTVANDPEKLRAIQQLLTQQKEWVRMYTDIKGEDLLATKNCPVVMTIASDLWMIKREYPYLEFKVPREGTFIAIDSFVIPAASTKQDLVYEFLNYLYQVDVVEYHMRRYGFCPPVMDVDTQGTGIFCPTKEQLQQAQFFRQTISDTVMNDMWVSILSQ